MNTDASRAAPAAAVSIRPATPPDASAIVTLVNDAYRQSEGRVFPSTTRTQRDDICGLIERMLVAESAGRIVGCVHLEINGASAHFGLLSADVSVHRRGIGSALIAHVEALARDAGCTVMRIDVIKEGEWDRIAYYGRHGYGVVRETPGQIWNDGADWGAAIDWHMVDMEKAL
jgi:N-acetylglutamate synthase-like GNAT family acetyltransferase